MPTFQAPRPSRALEVLVLADEAAYAGIAPALALVPHRPTVVGEADALLRQIWRQLPDIIIVVGARQPGAIPELCRQVRALLQTPILVIEQGASEHERIGWLDSGADDVLTLQHPESGELSARCAALLRRVQRQERRDPGALRVQAMGLQLDLTRRRLYAPGEQTIDVSPSQLSVLALLLSRNDEVVPAEVLARHLWGPEPPAEVRRRLEGLVYGLNRRFAQLRPRLVIERVHGRGYRLALREMPGAP